jgi:hypothetical protein
MRKIQRAPVNEFKGSEVKCREEKENEEKEKWMKDRGGIKKRNV